MLSDTCSPSQHLSVIAFETSSCTLEHLPGAVSVVAACIVASAAASGVGAVLRQTGLSAPLPAEFVYRVRSSAGRLCCGPLAIFSNTVMNRVALKRPLQLSARRNGFTAGDAWREVRSV